MNCPALAYGILAGHQAVTEWLCRSNVAKLAEMHAGLSADLGSVHADRFLRWKIEQLRSGSTAASVALFGDAK